MFNQSKNFLNRELMVIQYKNVLNENNLAGLSRFKIAKILKNESYVDKDLFLHHLISKWIDSQKTKDIEFIKHLKKIIKRSQITLSDTDKFELTLLEERSFSEYRHIKILNVSTFLLVKETVGIKFTHAQLYEKTTRLTLLKEVDLMVSNKRIILQDEKLGIESFFWQKIKSYTFASYGFEFNYDNNKRYVVRIHDQITLNNTLKNYLSKKMKFLAKKEKKVN